MKCFPLIVLLTSCLAVIGCSGAPVDQPQSLVNENQPLWVISSDNRSHTPIKRNRPEGKPTGPLSLSYVLESWKADEHKLVLTLRSKREISNWSIALPQLKMNLKNVVGERLKSSQARPDGIQKVVKIGSLATLDRLLVTVSAEFSGQSATKTIAIPLAGQPAATPRTCKVGQKPCFDLLPSKSSR